MVSIEYIQKRDDKPATETWIITKKKVFFLLRRRNFFLVYAKQENLKINRNILIYFVKKTWIEKKFHKFIIVYGCKDIKESMWVCVCVCVCMCVPICACVYVCLRLVGFVLYLYVFVLLYLYIHICRYACVMYICMCGCVYTCEFPSNYEQNIM